MTGSIACVYPLLKHPLLTKCSLFHKNNVRSATCNRSTASNQSNLHDFTNTHLLDLPRHQSSPLPRDSRPITDQKPSRRRLVFRAPGSSRKKTKKQVCTVAKLRTLLFFSFAIISARLYPRCTKLYLEVLAGQALRQKAEELLADLLQLSLSRSHPSSSGQETDSQQQTSWGASFVSLSQPIREAHKAILMRCEQNNNR